LQQTGKQGVWLLLAGLQRLGDDAEPQTHDGMLKLPFKSGASAVRTLGEIE